MGVTRRLASDCNRWKKLCCPISQQGWAELSLCKLVLMESRLLCLGFFGPSWMQCFSGFDNKQNILTDTCNTVKKLYE